MGNCAEGVSKKVPSTPSKGFKVCICGGAGGIGQPLCMLMAMNPLVSELSVYDLSISMVPAQGVAADLSHIERRCKANAFVLEKDQKPIENLGECLKDCHLVLVPAGVPRKPGQDRSDLLKINAGIAKSIVEACAAYCPKAILGLIVNPVNSVVPAMAALYEKAGLDPKRIIGVTTLDCVRANKFVHEITGVAIENIDVPVVGGHAGKSILPLFSQDKAGAKVPPGKVAELDTRVQDAGTEVVQAKAGKGSATLSMAYAGARFGNAVLQGLAGKKTTECAYVKVTDKSVSDLPFFSTRVTFGPSGVEKVHPIGKLTAHEQNRLKEATELLRGEIDAGLEYAQATELAKA